ncbi:MAG: hypothetical protein RL199_2478, partial [Pseudomonadota bacterium]
MRSIHRLASLGSLVLVAACVVDKSASRGDVPPPGSDSFL